MKKKLLSSFGATILSSGLFFSFNFFIAKTLGADTYGQITYYLSFIQIVALLISFNYAALYMGNQITREDNNTFSLFISIESIAFLILSIPAYFIINNYINNTEITILILLIAYFLTLTTLVGLKYNAEKKVTASILISALIPRIILIISFLSILYFTLGTAKYYLYVYLFSLAFVSGYFLLKFKPNLYIKKDIFKRAWKFYLLSIIGASFKPLANILQKEYYGYKEVANLSLALLFLAGFYLIGSVLVKFVLPKIHEAWKKRDLRTIENIYSNNTTLEVLLISPIVVLVLTNVDTAIILLGESYILLPMYLYILMIGFLPDLFTGITGNILRSTENEKYEIFNEILVLSSGLGLIYILKDYKYGVVLAIAISNFLYNLLKFLEVYFILKIAPFNLKKFFLLVGYMILLVCIFEFLKRIENFYLELFFSLFVMGIVYLINYKIIQKTNLLKGFR